MTSADQDIRDHVRDRYAAAALSVVSGSAARCGPSDGPWTSCCGPSDGGRLGICDVVAEDHLSPAAGFTDAEVVFTYEAHSTPPVALIRRHH